MDNKKSKMHILRFLKEWIYWAETYGKDIDRGFQRDLGLCPSLDGWLSADWLSADWLSAACHTVTHWKEVDEAREYFSHLIPTAVGYPDDPVNCPFGGWSTYRKEAREKSAHKNTERLCWVRETIIKLEKDLNNQ